jgi:hypothetical protein
MVDIKRCVCAYAGWHDPHRARGGQARLQGEQEGGGGGGHHPGDSAHGLHRRGRLHRDAPRPQGPQDRLGRAHRRGGQAKVCIFPYYLLDPNPPGSAFIWLFWIRIRVGNANSDPGECELTKM